MSKKIGNWIFIVIIFGFLFAGLLKTAFFPTHGIIKEEKRDANTLPSFTFGSYFDKSYQKAVKSALSDQVFFAQDMKKLYNSTDSRFVKASVNVAKNAVKKLSADNPEKRPPYIKMGDLNLYGDDYILYNPTEFDWVEQSLDRCINSYNDVIKKNQDVEFYLYYIEKDTDNNFETGEKSGIFEHLKKGFDIPDKNISRFEISDFETYSKYFYRTDHHWNLDGSYKAYTEVMPFLGCDEKLIPKGEKIKLSDDFAGSKTLFSETAEFKEDFYAYKYDYPVFAIFENGSVVSDYGKQDEFFEGTETESPTYGTFYGNDSGEIVLDSGYHQKESILVIGESYDNAILKLIASHFYKTYSIDLRYYEAVMGQKFDITRYIKDNNIKKVLIIGNVDFFIGEDFITEH